MPPALDVTLVPNLRPTAEAFALAVARGRAREIACFGPRGEGKTWAALWGMVLHALEHRTRGYPLPTTWLGVRDTFANHRPNTHQSMLEPAWEGRWQLAEDGHLGVFLLAGLPIVRVWMVGVDSPQDAERVRTQCHGVWVDEAAPAATLGQGVSEGIWGMAISSMRLVTHAHVAMLTSNYPDIDHWSWQRFKPGSHIEGVLRFRIPRQERTSEDYARQLELAYANMPDLARRLVEGKPGTIFAGLPVARGFEEDFHVADHTLRPERDRAVWIGQDGGLTPATVIGQRVGDEIRILGAMHSEHDGMRGHLQGVVKPWLEEHLPWVLGSGTSWAHELVKVRYDPSIDVDWQGDIEANPLRVMRRLLPALYLPGPVKWDGRYGPLMAAVNARRPRLLIDPDARGLIKALGGAWHYKIGAQGNLRRDQPAKPNHPWEDYGDALCYLLAGMAPMADPARVVQKSAVTTLNAWGPMPRPAQWMPAFASLEERRRATTGGGPRWGPAWRE
jgi:hypothetical protein